LKKEHKFILMFLLCGFLRTRLFENLRMIPHAPGVQMARKLFFFFILNSQSLADVSMSLESKPLKYPL